jgi:hypothetical protein
MTLVTGAGLDVEDVADNPPGKKENDIGLEGDGMERQTLKAVETMPVVVPRHQHRYQCIRYREDKEIVVR